MARREMTPDDMPHREIPAVDLTDGIASRGDETILQVDRPMSMDYAKALKFGEDELTIRVEQNPMDEKPVLYYPFWVNGRVEGVMPGQIQKVKRKFVEVMLRSNQYRVQTESFNPGDPNERNLAHRVPMRRFMLSIIHDPDPRGPEWAQRCVMES